MSRTDVDLPTQTVKKISSSLLLALQPTVSFSLLGDFFPFCSFFTLLSPPSYSHYLQIFWWYLHLEEGVSRVEGLESLSDARGYAGGSLASGRATLVRQALVERPD